MAPRDDASGPGRPAVRSHRGRLFTPTDWWLAGATLLVAELLRMSVIEPAWIGHRCDPAPWVGLCAPRTLLLLTFRHQELGWLAALAGAVSLPLLALRRPLAHAAAQWCARVALCLGLAGLVLYSYDPAVAGVVLALLVLMQHGAGRDRAAGRSAGRDGAVPQRSAGRAGPAARR